MRLRRERRLGKNANATLDQSKINSFGNISVNSQAKSSAPIGVYLQRFETQEPFCASDRIRGEWIVKSSDNMELFNPSQNYETVIFHLPCQAIAKYGKIKILDICDKVWQPNVAKFTEIIKPINAIIVPTEELKKELALITDKPIHVITDGHDFSYYSRRVPNPHKERAKEVVWFGYSENSQCLGPFVNYIKSLGLKLKVICQHRNINPLRHADVFVKWDVNTYIHEISKSDFAILPLNQVYKSNNKDITALLCGIPVAKTKEDISRFMIPEERQLEIINRKNELSKYNIRERSAEYLRIIDEIKKADPIAPASSIPDPSDIQVYSSISSQFDKPRQDIQVFTDSATDIFKLPVMNAKIHKVLAHKYFSSKFTIYLDGNVFLQVEPSKLVAEMLRDADIALFKHPWRKCLYEEHGPAKQRVLPLFQPLMDEQVIHYRHQGMPANFGLGECGMLIRRNNDITAEFNDRWWAEICRYTNRDQMSFPYVLWKMKDRIKVNFIEGNVRKHPYFKYNIHG